MPVFTWRRDTKDKDVYTNEPYIQEGIRRSSSTSLDNATGGLRGYGSTGQPSPGQQLRHSLSAKPSSGRYNSSNTMHGTNIGHSMSMGTKAQPGGQLTTQLLTNNPASKQNSGGLSSKSAQAYRSGVRTPSSPNRVYRNMASQAANSYAELARPATASVASRHQAAINMQRPTTSMGVGMQEHHGMSTRYSAPPQEPVSPSHMYNPHGLSSPQNGLWQSIPASPGTPTTPGGQQKSGKLVDGSYPAGLPPPSPSRPGSFKFMARSSSARHEQHSSLLASLMVQQVFPGSPGPAAQSRILTLTPQPASKQRKPSAAGMKGLSGSANGRASARQSVNVQRDTDAASAEAQMLQRRFSTGSVAAQQQWAAAIGTPPAAPSTGQPLPWHGSQTTNVNARLAEAWGTLTCVRPSTSNTSNFALAFAAESQQEVPDVMAHAHPGHPPSPGYAVMQSQDEPVSPGAWGARVNQEWAHAGHAPARSPASSGHLGQYHAHGTARHPTTHVTHAFASPQAQQLVCTSSAASSKGSHTGVARPEGVSSVEGHNSNPSGWVTNLAPGQAWGSHSGSADGSHASADMHPPPGQHWSGVEETSSQSVMVVQAPDQRPSKVKARSQLSQGQHQPSAVQPATQTAAAVPGTTAPQTSQEVGRSDQGDAQHHGMGVTAHVQPHSTQQAAEARRHAEPRVVAHAHEDAAHKQWAAAPASTTATKSQQQHSHDVHTSLQQAQAPVNAPPTTPSSRPPAAHPGSSIPASTHYQDHHAAAHPATPTHTAQTSHPAPSAHAQPASPKPQHTPTHTQANSTHAHPTASPAKANSATPDVRAADASTNPLHMFAGLASKRVPIFPPKLPLPVDEDTLLGGHINAEHTAALPGYAVGKVIGEGGFCQVRLAVHRLSGRRVAVKIIDKLKLADAAEARRIQREIRVMRHLSHECIIKLFEVVDAPNILYLVMEHAPNGSLLDYVRSRKRLSEADASVVTQQIVAGLASCHQREVVHRDIKLENILMDTNNCMKLIDFGLSAFFIPGKQLRVHCGSPSYAAPEIVSRKHYDGPPVDVWSLGVVLFAMLAGHLPFHSSSGNKQELCAKIQEGRYTCPDHVGPQARDLLSRMLCVDPSRRITLEQVAAHPWLTQGARWDPLGASVYMVKVDPGAGLVYADEQLVVELEAAGYPRSMILQQLLVGENNYLVAGYFLLAEGKAEVIRRMRGALAAQRYIARSAPNSPVNTPDMAGLPLTPTSCTTAAALTGKLTAPPPTSVTAVMEKAVAVVPRAGIPVG